MRSATRWSLFAVVAGVLALASAPPAAAQACNLTISGPFDSDATLDPASGEFVIPAPATLGNLTASAPIFLDGELNENEVFDLNGEFTLTAGGATYTWVVLGGELVLNAADQAGTLDITAELVESSAGTASGTLNISASVLIVDILPEPTPLEVSGEVSGSVACGGSTPTTPTTQSSGGTVPPSATGPESDPNAAGTAVGEDLATTGFDPVLFVAALVATIVGVTAVLHGLGRTRIERWFPRSRRDEPLSRRRA